MKIKNSILFILVFLLAMFAGCNKAENTPLDIDIDIYDEGIASEDDLTPGDADPPEQTEQEGFYNAYLTILQENSSRLTSQEKNAYFEDGKIAVMNVFGNEAPELLYIYISNDNPVSFDLSIYSYTETDGPVQVFDSNLLQLAGGGGNYCVYIDTEGNSFIYRATYGSSSSFGFWWLYPNQNFKVVPDFGVYNFSADLAFIYYMIDHESGEALYMYSGEEVTEDKFNTSVSRFMEFIDIVIFQSSDLGPDRDYGLYKNDNLWKGITPFEAKSMTLTEALSWLETQ